MYDGKVSNTYARLEIDYIRKNFKLTIPASLSPSGVENIVYTDEGNVFSFYYTDTDGDSLNAYEIHTDSMACLPGQASNRLEHLKQSTQLYSIHLSLTRS